MVGHRCEIYVGFSRRLLGAASVWRVMQDIANNVAALNVCPVTGGELQGCLTELVDVVEVEGEFVLENTFGQVRSSSLACIRTT